MKILQFNVRLAEGGAAGVALDLHLRALKKGLSSRFIYGYGKGGKKSASHANYPQVIKHTPRLTSAANIALFRFSNRDMFGNLDKLYRTVTCTTGAGTAFSCVAQLLVESGRSGHLLPKSEGAQTRYHLRLDATRSLERDRALCIYRWL